ncbi:MAG: Re/Si-specific NAD(P)(+) transhydrogenase subunit alpha [Spirochaetia bacterium]|nr:Re/Si-specific NAD(P)(+) transhydrogenase subunit alpha [Spirochaetia bacterium]
MIISVAKEITKGEKRVAIVPESISKLTKIGHAVQIEAGAGKASGFSDEEYAEAGAKIISDIAALYSGTDLLLKVQPPEVHPSAGKHELEMLKPGALLIGFLFSLINIEAVKKAASLKIDMISMDAIPRITRAQRMDALSSQTNLAGYKAVLMAANEINKIFPLMMTAAGTISPAKVVILGAGVAGLQAIATAKRLGAVVEVSDVRPAVKEQVESLGAKYIEPPGEELEGSGGYAKEASAEYLQKQQDILTEHLSEADAVITTAQVPGKKAPVLITEAMVQRMKPGAVIVDMAAGTGGNCELTKPDQTIEISGVKIIGDVNIISHVAYNASQLYSRNLLSLIEYLTDNGSLKLELTDEIVAGSMICKDGQIVHEATKAAAN